MRENSKIKWNVWIWVRFNISDSRIGVGSNIYRISLSHGIESNHIVSFRSLSFFQHFFRSFADDSFAQSGSKPQANTTYTVYCLYRYSRLDYMCDFRICYETNNHMISIRVRDSDANSYSVFFFSNRRMRIWG